MDVLLLSTYDSDGAGKFTHQLAHALQTLGYTTRVVCVRSHSGEAHTQGMLDPSPWQQILYRLGEEFDRRVLRARPEYAFIHMREIPDRTVLKSSVWPDSCKLIVCTFLAGMLSPPALLALRARYGNPPLVFYGVDMNLYTAGCHYSRSCMGYRTDCSSCPAVPAYVRPRVRRMFKAKQACYQRMPGHVVVSSSHEHHQQIVSSRLFGGSDVRRILMAVDSDLYGAYEKDRMALRKSYGFAGRVMLLRSSSEPRKGCDLFVESIRSLSGDGSGILDQVVIVAIGDQYVADRLQGTTGVRLYSPGYIDDEQELARLYAVSDFFLNTSLADGGPVMLAQALMSGTPVITTDVGLARDLVDPPLNGRILDHPSATALSRSIAEFCGKSAEELLGMRTEARRLALERVGKPGYLRALSGMVRELIGES